MPHPVKILLCRLDSCRATIPKSNAQSGAFIERKNLPRQRLPGYGFEPMNPVAHAWGRMQGEQVPATLSRALARVDAMGGRATKAKACATAVVVCGLWICGSAAADWAPPTRLASSHVWSYDALHVVRDGAGDAVVLWHREISAEESQQGIEVATHHDDMWSSPTVLRSAPRQGPFEPSLAFGPGREVVAAWANGTQRIEAARDVLGRPWTRPVTLAREWETRGPQVAASERDPAKVLFRGAKQSHLPVTAQLVMSAHQRGWSRPRTVAAARGYNARHTEAIGDAQGEIIVAWLENERRVRAVVLNRRGFPEAPPQLLSPPRTVSASLQIAVNARGDAVIVWRRAGKSDQYIEAATRRAGRRFSSRSIVSAHEDAEPQAAINPEGEATVVFARHDPLQANAATSSERDVAEASTKSLTGRWSAPIPLLSPLGGSTFEPVIAASPSGQSLIAAWTVEPPNVEADFIESAVLRNGAWEASSVISPSASFGPVVAVSPNGDATAAWRHSAGGDESHPELSIETAEYRPNRDRGHLSDVLSRRRVIGNGGLHAGGRHDLCGPFPLDHICDEEHGGHNRANAPQAPLANPFMVRARMTENQRADRACGEDETHREPIHPLVRAPPASTPLLPRGCPHPQLFLDVLTGELNVAMVVEPDQAERGGNHRHDEEQRLRGVICEDKPDDGARGREIKREERLLERRALCDLGVARSVLREAFGRGGRLGHYRKTIDLRSWRRFAPAARGPNPSTDGRFGEIAKPGHEPGTPRFSVA